MIKAVVFDCFGVLTTDGWLFFKEKYLSDNSENKKTAEQANKEVDAGIIDYATFLAKLAKLVSLDEKQVKAVIESNVRNKALFEFIQYEIKPYYKVGLLSNASHNALERLFEERQIRLFDAAVFSFEVGTIKPASIMYERIAQKLNLETSECLYIDDQEKFVEGALLSGMQTIHFTNNENVMNKIRNKLDARAS
jgi:putative hydrolase of the HAD superfamily